MIVGEKNHSVWDEDTVFQVSRCSDAYWTMQLHPGWSAHHCNSCTAALCAIQIGHQHSSGIMCITHHLILLYEQHSSTMCALSHLLLGYPLPTCKILLLFPKFKRGRHAIQFLCLFKWRHLTLLESLLTMLSFPSSLLSDIGLNHIHDLQLFLNFRYFWMAEGHCFLFPKSMPSISMP